jgi:hypothetical protein
MTHDSGFFDGVHLTNLPIEWTGSSIDPEFPLTRTGFGQAVRILWAIFARKNFSQKKISVFNPLNRKCRRFARSSLDQPYQ